MVARAGNDVLAVALVQLNSAALVSQSSDGVSGGVLGGVQRSGRSAEVEQCRTSQVVGGQQGGDRSSLLGSSDSVSGGHSGNASLRGEFSGASTGSFVLSIERSVRERAFGVLSHDAQVSGSGVDGIGAGAGTGNNGNLRHNAGNTCNLSGQAGGSVQQIQAALQLGTGRVVEGDDRGAGLGGHLQHADILFDILHANGGAVLKYDVDALTDLRCRKRRLRRHR